VKLKNPEENLKTSPPNQTDYLQTADILTTEAEKAVVAMSLMC
jgi:hypothetical protein